MRSDPATPASRTRCIRLTQSCSIVRVRPDAALLGLAPGQTVNIATDPPSARRRISSFTILQTHDHGDFSMLVHPTRVGGVSDGLTSDNCTRVWVSDPLDSAFTKAGARTEGPILCILAGSGAAALGAVAHAGTLANTDVVFVGRQEDCEVVPSSLLGYLATDAPPGAPRRSTSWNSTVRGRPGVRDITGLLNHDSYAVIVACGPRSFCRLVRSACTDLGISASHLVTESFGGAEPAGDSVASSAESIAVIDLFGEAHALRWAAGESLVAAMLRVGISAPYSCRAGICSTCQCAVLIGETSMQVDLGLSDDEKADGLALACQLRPISAALALRFASPEARSNGAEIKFERRAD